MSRGKKVETHSISLDCGHSQPWVSPCPVAGEVITCIDCGKGAVVLKGHPVALKLRCDSCRYTRKVPGDDEEEHSTKTYASLRAFSHMSQHRGHTMSLYDHRLCLRTYEREEEPSDVPF